MDFIFTLCDRAAGATCPAWPGQAITPQWSFADPASVVSDRDKQLKAFTTAQFEIANRIRLKLNLPIHKIERMSLQTRLREMGLPHDKKPEG